MWRQHVRSVGAIPHLLLLIPIAGAYHLRAFHPGIMWRRPGLLSLASPEKQERTDQREENEAYRHADANTNLGASRQSTC